MENELKKVLTKRELDVGWLIHKGFPNSEIAAMLKISINTVKDHVKNIFKKLDIGNRTELAGLSMWENGIENIVDSSMPTTSSTIYDMSGIWLSEFKFDMYRRGKFISGIQFNLELIEPQFKKNNYIGKNLQCSGSTKTEYFHRLQFEVFGDNVLGKWFNRNTNNYGCYQLYIHTNGNMMFGKHLGNASNNQIMSGEWVWIRVEIKDVDVNLEDFLKKNHLSSFKKLEGIFENFINEGLAIDLNRVI